MAGIGYSSGQRCTQIFNWYKILKPKINAPEAAYNISCVAAHIWGESLEIMPVEVMEDYHVATEKLDGLRMDGGANGKGDGLIRYTVEISGEEKSYVMTQAPRSGICSSNYCK